MNLFMDYKNEKSRDEIAIDNVFSFMALHRRTIITHIECERQESVYRVLIHYMSTVTNKKHYIGITFYRNAEENEAKHFINTICETFCVTLSGDPIV